MKTALNKKNQRMSGDVCKALRQSLETVILLRKNLGFNKKELQELFLAAAWVREAFDGTKEEQELTEEWYKRINKLEKATNT